MIYTDGVHLVSDFSLRELHRFADELGLKRHWFRGVRRGHPHYDLTTAQIAYWAERRGARRISPRGVVKAIRRMPQ